VFVFRRWEGWRLSEAALNLSELSGRRHAVACAKSLVDDASQRTSKILYNRSEHTYHSN
jgi:hypothetical protein